MTLSEDSARVGEGFPATTTKIGHHVGSARSWRNNPSHFPGNDIQVFPISPTQTLLCSSVSPINLPVMHPASSAILDLPISSKASGSIGPAATAVAQESIHPSHPGWRNAKPQGDGRRGPLWVQKGHDGSYSHELWSKFHALPNHMIGHAQPHLIGYDMI